MYEIEVREALRDRVWRSLPPVTMALMALYVVFTISHALLLPAEIRMSMAVMAAGTSVALLCMSVAVRRVSRLKCRTYPIAFLVIVLLSSNSAVHIYLTRDIVQTTNVMLVILGAGFVVLAGSWYALALAFAVGSWLLAVANLSDQSLFVHFSFALLSATIASVAFRFVHVRDLVENHRLRMYSESQSREMKHLASHDTLTGLANRRRFQEFLEMEVARARRTGEKVAVLFIDLDNFKPMNDTHGHDFGDEILVFFGDTLNEVVRDTDLVARLGGDEFAVLLTGLRKADSADMVIKKILRRFEQPETINGINTRIRPSIGSAVLPDDADAPDALIRLADQRMYAHKEQTRESNADNWSI